MKQEEVLLRSECAIEMPTTEGGEQQIVGATSDGALVYSEPIASVPSAVIDNRQATTLGDIVDGMKMVYKGTEKIAKPIINFMGQHPYVTQLLLSGAVYSVNPVIAIQMIIKTAGSAITNEVLLKGYAGCDFKEQPIQTKVKSTAVITGLQTVVADLNEVGGDKIGRNVWNNAFNATLDILTNDVSAVKNLALQHPVIAQSIATTLSILSNIAVGKYTKSMPVALVKSALSLCTGIFSSKFGTSIFSEVKKLIGYGKQDAPSEQIMSQMSGEHAKVD